jgi:hypothetical protein
MVAALGVGAFPASWTIDEVRAIAAPPSDFLSGRCMCQARSRQTRQPTWPNCQPKGITNLNSTCKKDDGPKDWCRLSSSLQA